MKETLISIFCVALIVCGISILWDSANRPGPPAHANEKWPQRSTLQRQDKLLTLLMFVNPQCDCSQASLSELRDILAKTNEPLKIMILFVTEPAQDWKHTGLLSAAQLIASAQIVEDLRAFEASIFGALTSGQVLLYDPAGELVFAGGITPARGHAGENPGKSSILSFVNNKKIEQKTAPVFGCLLKNSL